MDDIEAVRVWVTKAVADVLAYTGHEGYTVWNTGEKVVIQLRSGETYWFMYDPGTVEKLHIYGAVVSCLMHQKNEAL